MTILVAIDIDGVLNNFSKSKKHLSETFTVEHEGTEYPIQLRSDVLDRFKVLLSHPAVVPAWLTTWLDTPKQLAEFAEKSGFDKFIKHEAPARFITTAWGGRERNPLLGNTSDSFMRINWWKYPALEVLKKDLAPERVAFFDDDLGRCSPRSEANRAEITYSKFFCRTHATAGLTHENLDAFEAWLKRTK